MSAEQSLLLPFDQFAFAELKNEVKEQRLRLVFATHEITLRGHALRRIETAMQRMELAFLTAMPANQRLLIAEGQPRISDIEVLDITPDSQARRDANDYTRLTAARITASS